MSVMKPEESLTMLARQMDRRTLLGRILFGAFVSVASVLLQVPRATVAEACAGCSACGSWCNCGDCNSNGQCTGKNCSSYGSCGYTPAEDAGRSTTAAARCAAIATIVPTAPIRAPVAPAATAARTKDRGEAQWALTSSSSRWSAQPRALLRSTECER